MIDAELYRRLFAEISTIGHGERGWNRIAWGEGEDAAHLWFEQTARALSLELERDLAGNLWAIEPGSNGGAFDAVGSHLDTVGDGGAFDGVLGVVAGFVAVEAVRRRGAARPRPLAVGCMVDEEGARFGATIYGSRALVGEWKIDELLARRDADGVLFADAAAARGVTAQTLADAPSFLPRIASWIEVHVEQGKRLVDVPAALGVATVLAPRERWSVTYRGAADHAGTTPMVERRDPLVAAARTVVRAHDVANAEPGAVATVGRLSVLPGSSNVIPAEVRFSLDVRACHAAALERVRAQILVDPGGGIEHASACDSRDPGCFFDDELRTALHAAAAAESAVAIDLSAYAGHDAGVLARVLPAAMLFVRNPTGSSHNKTEFTSEADALTACAVLARTLIRTTPR